jgi:predicted metallo-beta-lactamase superfamily hydrolase
MTESISVVAEKANIIRVFHTLLKHFTPRDSTYFKEYVIEGFIVKYV